MVFGFLAALATVIGSFVVPVVLFMLLPGRKGSMRTVREASHPLDADAAWRMYADRLAFDGFFVDPSGRPQSMVAKRSAPPTPPGEERIVTNASKPMTVEVTFQPIPGGVRANIVGRLNDFVVLDTGEGRQVDLTLHRLMSADLNAEPPPAVPGPSFSAVVALAGAVIALAGPLLARNLSADSGWRSVGATVGFAAGALFAISVATQAIGEIRKRPLEVRGTWIACLAIIIAVAALAFAAVSLARSYGVHVRSRNEPAQQLDLAGVIDVVGGGAVDEPDRLSVELYGTQRGDLGA